MCSKEVAGTTGLTRFYASPEPTSTVATSPRCIPPIITLSATSSSVFLRSHTKLNAAWSNLDHAELIVRELRFQRVCHVGQDIELAAGLEHLAFAGCQDDGLVGPVSGCKHLDGEFLHFDLAFCLLSALLMRPIHFRTRKT